MADLDPGVAVRVLVTQIGGTGPRALLRISAGVPEAMNSPKSSTKMWLERESTVATSCSTIRSETRRSPFSTTRRNTEARFSDSRMSKPESGSSRSTTSGRVARARATSTRAARAQGRAPTEAGHVGQVEQLRELVDPFVFRFAAGRQRTWVDHVPPQPLAGEADPVGQDQMLADGQSHEQLGLLKRPRQARRGSLADCAW